MHIALIGYGEVGRILGEDLRAQGHAVSSFDVLVSQPGHAPLLEHARAHGVGWCASVQEAVASAQLIICAVTASQAVAAAQQAAAHLPAQAFS